MDYHLKPIGKTCAGTGEPLVPGERCYSVVVEDQDELVRLDYSETGWDGPPEDAIGQWQCVVPEPETKKTEPINPDDLMRYFEQLHEDANHQQEAFCYVLALLLLQKRRLKLDGSRVEGEIEYLQLTGAHGEGQFEVRDQQLGADEIATLQASLNEHLATEWTHG